jgi:hypothetical protein
MSGCHEKFKVQSLWVCTAHHDGLILLEVFAKQELGGQVVPKQELGNQAEDRAAPGCPRPGEDTCAPSLFMF